MTGGMTDRLQKVEALWQKAGFKAKAFDDIHQLVWEKFICNDVARRPQHLIAQSANYLPMKSAAGGLRLYA